MTDNMLYNLMERVSALEGITSAQDNPAPAPGLVELRTWGHTTAINTGSSGVTYNGILGSDNLTTSPTGMPIYTVASTNDTIRIPQGVAINNSASISFEMFFQFFTPGWENSNVIFYKGTALASQPAISFSYTPGSPSDYWAISQYWPDTYGYYYYYTAPPLVNGDWYDVQFSWEAPRDLTAPTIYLNGSAMTWIQSSFGNNGNCDDSPYDLNFFNGSFGGYSSPPWNVNIGVVRWENTVLSSGQFASNRAYDSMLVLGI